MAGVPRMGRRRGGRYDGRVRRYLSPRCLGMHATLIILLPAFSWLTWWQLNRAQGGNTLSWAYVFLWPAFGFYAIYTWWQLIHDQAARVPGRRGGPRTGDAEGTGRSEVRSGDTGPYATANPAGTDGALPPGWALSGGRKKNIAIAAAAPIDAQRGGRGERFIAQTPEEAARLAAYNRYLAELAEEDGAEPATSTGTGTA